MPMTPSPPPVLRSKMAPALAPVLLERKRLNALLAPLRGRRLALVVGGAGSGKTTFLAQAVQSLPLDHAWLGLDTHDQDCRVFLRGVICAIRERHADFGAEVLRLLARLPAVPGKDLPMHPGGPLDALLHALEAEVPGHLVLVLDDFHLLHAEQEDSPVLEVVEYLLARLPRNVHLVMAGRTLPPLRLSRLRAAREVLDIGPAELAFTREESAALCRLLAPREPKPEHLDALHAATEGWAAALVLACGDAALPIPLPGGSVRQYFDENVLASQPKAIQEFMLTTAVLPWLEPELCDALHGPGSQVILERLRNHCLLVLTSQGEERPVRYHHLLRAFLLERGERLRGRERCAVLRRQAGDYFAARGDLHNALEQYLAAEAWEPILALLSGLVLSDLARCPLHLVVRTAEALPRDCLERSPAVLHLRARIASMQGDMPAALHGLEQALARLDAEADLAGSIRCRKDLGFHRYLVGDVQGAYATLRSLWPESDLDTWFYGEVGGLLVFLSTLLGRFDEAEAWRDAALERVSHSAAPPALLARQWVMFCDSVRLQLVGDFTGAELLLHRALETFTAAGADFLLPVVHMQAALNGLLRQRPFQGLEHAEQGLRLARQLGIADHQLAWLLCAKAGNSFLAGDASTAQRCAQEALEIFTALGNPWGQSTVRELFGQLHLRAGRRADAVDALRMALKLVRDTGLVVWQEQLRLGLAEALLAAGHPEEAGEILDTVNERPSASVFNRFRSHLVRGALAVRQGQWPQAGDSLHQALSLAEERGYTAWLAQYASLLQTLAGVCPQNDAGERLRALIARWPRARGGHLVSEEVTPPLRVNCLGGFKVEVGERVIAPDAWRNAKARRIFQYLALIQPLDFTPKDVLLELAWPDEDPQRTGGRFHVALHALRRLLEPQLQRGQQSSYLLRRGEDYRLELGHGGRADVPDFLQAVEQARRSETMAPEHALERYLAAEALHTGELLPSQSQEEWLDDLRLRVRFAHGTTLSRIMRLLEARQEWSACIDYAEKHLALEEHSEPTYRALMRCRAALGDTAGALEAFRRCERAIVHDLGYPLSAATVALQAALCGSRS